MNGSVVGRSSFERLRSEGRRFTAGPLRVRFLPGSCSRLAFANGRKFGSAVERNRARRRLRAAFGQVATKRSAGAPSGDFLVSSGRSVLTDDYHALVSYFERVFESIERAYPAGGAQR